jgi:hypothetical protein
MFPSPVTRFRKKNELTGKISSLFENTQEAAMGPADGIIPIADIPGAVTTIRLAGMIRDDSARILANWSMRIATLPIFRALPELALDDLQQDMPELLEAILQAVSVSPYELDPTPIDDASRKAEAHGTKRAGTFPIDVVLSEIQALQREVRNAIWRNSTDIPVAVVHELDERLNEVFEVAERSVASAWVKRRELNSTL